MANCAKRDQAIFKASFDLLPDSMDLQQFKAQALRILYQKCLCNTSEKEMCELTEENRQEMCQTSWDLVYNSFNAMSSTCMNATQEAGRIQKWLEEGANRSVCGLKDHVPNIQELTVTL